MRIESLLEFASLEAESYQTYQLRIHGNNVTPRVQQIHTRYDRRHVHSVDGVVRLLGEQEVDYLDVPVGAEQLEVTSTANTLLRISVAPCRTAYPAGWEGSADASLVGSIWNLNADEVLAQLAATDYPASRRWRIAQRLGRDNRYRDGGIQAWNLLRQLAAENPAHADLKRWALKAKLTYTTYKTLLPVEAGETTILHDAWFVISPLRSPEAPPGSPVLATSLVDDAVEALPGGTFVEVPAAGEVACPLPPGVLDTQIRVAVERHRRVGTSPSELRVQCDSSAPIHLRLYDDEALPPTLLRTSISECGLAALNRRFGPFDAGTLGGPFAGRRHAAPWIEAATTELNVASGTRWVRVANDSEHPLRVCLAYRTSREVALTESEFLSCVMRQPDFAETFLAILRGVSPAVLVDTDALAELRNHCEPLLRQLQRHHRAFAAGVSPPADGASESSLSAPTGEGLTDQYQQARQLMEQRQWVEALALWTAVAEKSTGDVRRDAILQRVEALTELSETFLAETELRGRVLHDADVAVRKAAAHRLAEAYREAGDTDALQRLASAALLTDPSPEAIAAFASAAAENDDWPAVLIATLATPPHQRSAELLLQAAYQQGWWQIFQLTLDQISDTPLRNYWAAIGSIRQGDFAAACDLLAQAGARGMQLRAQLIRGHQIVQRLRAVDLDERLQGLREWEEWSATHPGPHTWQHDATLVSSCRRVDRVVSDPADDGYEAYRATTERPVEICVNGPVELRIEARPLHPSGADAILDDWLFVRGSGRQLVWPITRNRPASTLQLQTDPARVPGRLVQTQLRLGPGQHRLHVWAESSDLLVRVAAGRPQCSLGMLPPITPATVAAVVEGQWGQMSAGDVNRFGAAGRPRTARLVTAGISPGALVDLALVRPAEIFMPGPRISPIVTASQRAAVGLRDGTLSADEARRILAQPTSASILNRGELIELAARAEVPPAAFPALS
ncbi:MAG TPA: hypothetical protein VFZ51_06870, partial [Woeseiaceae bacterium]